MGLPNPFCMLKEWLQYHDSALGGNPRAVLGRVPASLQAWRAMLGSRLGWGGGEGPLLHQLGFSWLACKTNSPIAKLGVVPLHWQLPKLMGWTHLCTWTHKE